MKSRSEGPWTPDCTDLSWSSLALLRKPGARAEQRNDSRLQTIRNTVVQLRAQEMGTENHKCSWWRHLWSMKRDDGLRVGRGWGILSRTQSRCQREGEAERGQWKEECGQTADVRYCQSLVLVLWGENMILFLKTSPLLFSRNQCSPECHPLWSKAVFFFFLNQQCFPGFYHPGQAPLSASEMWFE